MPNLLYPYLIGLASVVIVPLVGLLSYIAAQLKGREYDRLRQRLPLATRYEDLQAKVSDLQKDRDLLQAEVFEAQQTIDEATRERTWLAEHRQEIEDMRAEREQLARHRIEYEELCAKLADAQQKLEEAVKQCKQAEFELEQRRAQMRAAETRFKSAESNLVDVNKRLQNAESDLKKVKDGLQRAEEKKRAAEEELASASAKLAEVRSHLAELDKRRNELKREVAAASSTVDRLASQESELKSSVQALQTRAEHAQTYLDELRSETAIRDRAMATDSERLSELLTPAIDSSEFEQPIAWTAEAEALQHVRGYLAAHGLRFSRRVVDAFHTSLKVAVQSPLLVLAGISGTGKSLLPRRYAEAMGMHFLNVPVQPRWDGPQDLLGFFNYLENRYKPTSLIQALIQMDRQCESWLRSKNLKFEHFIYDRLLLVLLDEMNLARIEYYFSECLSRLETRRDIDLARDADRLKASLLLDVGGVGMGDHKPPTVFIDRNVMFVGTMNEDESTMTLSDKVIDRAGVMRFSRPRNLADSAPKGVDPASLRASGYLSRSAWNKWIDANSQRRVPDEISGWVEDLNLALAQVGRPFGYRVRDAIAAYICQYPDASERGIKWAFADQIEQRILPKVRGLDLAERGVSDAIEGIAEVVSHLEDDSLASAINDARNNASGHLFLWGGVERKNDE